MMLLARLGIAAALLLTSSGALEAQEERSAFIPAPMNPAADGAVSGINQFTLDLFKQSEPGKNAFLSPASVSMAVALAYRGARGVTADELRRVFHYSAAPETYLAAQAPLFRAMTFSAKGRELSTNNSLWVQDRMPMNPAYLADVTGNAGAGLLRVDYAADADLARDTINKWVSAKTNNRINDLLSKANVTPSTRAILVNTIYWKANWASPFAPDDTKTEPFRRLDGRVVSTPLMHQEDYFDSIERGGVKAIELPYEGDEVSMVALMPNNAKGLPKFEAGLTASSLAQWLSDLDKAEPRRTILTLPKMHLAWREDLVSTLRAMGVQAAFDNRADFTGITTMPPGRALSISAIIHQSWLDIDETRSEAAAASAVEVGEVIVSGTLPKRPPPPPFIFRADKPFLFLLRDRRTGMILFIGRFTGPEKAD